MVAQVSKTCCAADFRIGVPQAGWETRDTLDLEVCATKTGMRPFWWWGGGYFLVKLTLINLDLP